jgi:hypothetical protein
MLTITVDPRYPVEALETCANLAELLGDYISFRRQDCEMPDGAAAGFGMLCDAIAAAQHRAIGAVVALTRPAPILPAAPAKSTAEQLAECIGVSVDEAKAMIADGLRHASALRAEVPAAPVASQPAPRLTEPRPTAANRRRPA